MAMRKVSERTQRWRQSVFKNALLRARISFMVSSEVQAAIARASGRLRAIEAKRAMYALTLFSRGRPWDEAKEAARLQFSPWYTADPKVKKS